MAEEKIKSTTTPKTQAKPKKRKKMRTYQQRQDRTMDYRISGIYAFSVHIYNLLKF